MSTMHERTESVPDILAPRQTPASDGLRLAAQALEILAKEHAEAVARVTPEGRGARRNSGEAAAAKSESAKPAQ